MKFMIPAVLLALALVTPAFTLPFSTQGLTTTGIHGSTGIQGTTGIQGEGTPTGVVGQTFTHGEKTGLQAITQTHTVTTQQGQTTGIQGSQVVDTPAPAFGREEKVEPSEFSTANQANQPVTVQQAEPVRVQSLNENVQYTESQYQNPAQQQSTYSERPLLLAPFSQILSPLVVPAETVSARFILMAIEPIRRVQQDVTPVEKQTPYQQTPQLVAVDPNQVQITPVQPVQQVYTLQPVKQVAYQQEPQSVTGYVPTQTHTVEPVPSVQTQEPKQAVYQQGLQQPAYVPVQAQHEAQPVQQVYNVQPEVPFQQQTQTADEVQKTHQITSVRSQINEYTQGQVTGSQQTGTPIEPITTGIHKSTFTPVQGQTYEPNQQQQVPYQPGTVEKGSPVPLVPEYTQTQSQIVPENQQVQSQQEVNVKQSSQQQTVQTQTTGYTQDQTYKNQEVEYNQQQNVNAQPQPYNFVANNAAEYVVSNFGEKLPQHQTAKPSVENLSTYPEIHQQQTAVVAPEQEVVIS